jgi:hypothetical protein
MAYLKRVLIDLWIEPVNRCMASSLIHGQARTDEYRQYMRTGVCPVQHCPPRRGLVFCLDYYFMGEAKERLPARNENFLFKLFAERFRACLSDSTILCVGAVLIYMVNT